jgi:ribonuclease HI
LVDRDLGYIGINTNNVAEYTALNNALKRISSQHPSVRHLHVRCDSELLIRQVNGVYISRNKVLSPIIASIQAYSKSFTSIEFQWIPRELNSEADQLTNDALDNRAVVVDSDPVDELDSLPPSKRRRIEDDLYTPEF